MLLSVTCICHPISSLHLSPFLHRRRLDLPTSCPLAQSSFNHHHQVHLRPRPCGVFLPLPHLCLPPSCSRRRCSVLTAYIHHSTIPLSSSSFHFRRRLNLPIPHQPPQLNHSRRHHQYHLPQAPVLPPRPPTPSQRTTKNTVQSSRRTCSTLKTNHTPSAGAPTNAFANAAANTNTPSHHFVLKALPSPTAATGSREDPPSSPFVVIRRLTKDGQNLTREQV